MTDQPEVTEEELARWTQVPQWWDSSTTDGQQGMVLSGQRARLIATIRSLRAQLAEADGNLEEGAILGDMMASDRYKQRITELEAQQAALVEALEHYTRQRQWVQPSVIEAILSDLPAAARAHAERDAALERVRTQTHVYVSANDRFRPEHALDGLRIALTDPALKEAE